MYVAYAVLAQIDATCFTKMEVCNFIRLFLKTNSCGAIHCPYYRIESF